jgi:RsiW-degrading membrane proteinase PrsW (M82 family)
VKRLVLVEENGPRQGREHSLDGVELTLGRDPASRIAYDGNSSVSRRHALVRVESGRFEVADQHSSNGTLVNGQRVERAWLNVDDVVELGAGGPRLRVRIVDPSAEAATPATPSTTASSRPRVVDMTLYDPTRHAPAQRSLTGVIVVLGMMAVGVGLGLLLALMTAFELGLGVSIVGVLVAFAPAPIYILLWLWLDRYDPEPAWALGGTLLWGAGAATFVSSILNTIFGVVVHQATGNAGLSQFLSASLSAPFVEEGAKGLAVLFIFLALRREFDGVLDGVVYAGVVALGFATVENVLYYGRSLAQGGAGGLIFVFILRGILGPFGHAVFTAMTGIGLGIARQSHNTFVRIAAPIAGYGGAVFLHSLWNTVAGLSSSPAGFLAAYVLLWVPLFFMFLALVLWMGWRESALIKRMLKYEVGLGLITQEQADIAGSWPRRMAWLFGSLGDFARLRARRRFLTSVTRLALSYWHVERANEAGGETLSAGLIPTFRTEVARLKAVV